MSPSSSAFHSSLLQTPKAGRTAISGSGFLISSFDYKDSTDGEKRGFGHSTTASTWLLLIVSPSETRTSRMRPDFGDLISFCIFIASTTMTP